MVVVYTAVMFPSIDQSIQYCMSIVACLVPIPSYCLFVYVVF